MEEIDIENVEDLNELEARLYAQIHHEPSGDHDVSESYKEASPVRQVTTTSIINNRPIDKTRVGRYWNEKVSARTPSKPLSISEIDATRPDIERSAPNGSGEKRVEKPAETVDKSFQPPVKNLSNLRVNPFASGNGPKTKGSSTLPRVKITTTEKAKKVDAKVNKGPFGRQINKLANAIKYDGKKQKAKAARAKVKKVQLGGLVNLLSSDESEVDEVIEVPLPAPSIVTIDTSSDEENPTTQKDGSSFLKPEALLIKDNSSRCTSPCSVISDDFIGQNDRSRLLEEDERPDDEDLLTLQIDVDSLMEAPEISTDKATEKASIPARRASNKSTTNYRVTQSAFRALDVYESESDFQDSVYSKGSKSTKPSIVVDLERESTSSDDVEEVGIAQKAKRLTKRRPSSINKDLEAYIDDSTDSELENQSESIVNKSRDGVVATKVPFISHGEALEKCITEDSPAKNTSVNTSDNEFIATLTTLAQGEPSPPSASRNQSDEEDNSITARAIAESVLRSAETSTTTAEPVMALDEEANDAIPNETLLELDQLFTTIDNMDSINKSNAEKSATDDSNASVELVAPIPLSQNSRPTRKRSIKSENTPSDPVYNIVYCEDTKLGGGIGWNDEMRKFYNDSWKGERFNVNAVRRQMQTQKSLWKIYTDDRFPKYRQYSHQKCMNCCEFGHIRSRCPKPRKVAVCYMCGEKGHYEPRCPNTICLRCGNKTRMFTKSCNSCNYQNRLLCPICKVRGHGLNLCPDKWRRYHSTTKPNEYPNNKIEYKNRKLCCICGMRGHLAENCRNAYNFAEYPICVSDIRSHQKSYDDISIKTIRSGIGYNLMYKPEEDVSFELAENQSPHHYYGRFLMAVGMGYLLARKRKASATVAEQPAEKQKKEPGSTVLKAYVVNPFARAALDKSPTKAPTAVQNIDVDKPTDESPPLEVHDSTIPITIDEDIEAAPEPSTSKQALQQVEKLISESNRVSQTVNKEPVPSATAFKTPDPAVSGCSSKREHEITELIDSDSNYSFSEHFEAPATRNPGNAREMDPLPDFIPIVDDDYDDQEPDESMNAGISKRFVSIDTDDDEEEKRNELPDIPCEAKIFLTNFHSKFLLSPNGNKFLVERSKEFDIKAKLEWTSVGHILIIFGLRLNQDKFHTELLLKFRELSEKLNRTQLEKSQKVPRKTEVLIRFLRENLNQLLVNLGNPNDLIKRMNFQEHQQTKTGWKSAEKTRRLLNMILIGQAGLCNGSLHLDNLLSQLRLLIDEHKEDTVPNETRMEIETHWKFIFSSQRHEKYPELVQAYNNLSVKNRFQNINIDPRLLGKKMLDTTLTKAQKDKMEKPADTNQQTKSPSIAEKTSTPVKLVPNPLAGTKSQMKQPKTPVFEKKRPQNILKANSPSVSQTQSNKQKPAQSGSQTATDSPVASKIRAVNAEWEAKCTNLLTEINKTDKLKKAGAPVRDNKASSMFWSREAIKYIDECMELGKSNASFVAKLSRVQTKSQKGLLSYNDYRAIIKIHNAIKGKH